MADHISTSNDGGASWGFWLIVLLPILCFAVGAGWKRVSFLGKYGEIDAVAFRGVNLDSGQLWVLFTATLSHANTFHIVNNTIMLGVCVSIEREFGAFALVALFFTLGACGWLASYAAQKVDSETYAFTQWADTVGSSPATYGLAVFAAIRLPLRAIESPFPDSAPTSMLLQPWFMITWVFLLPFVRKSNDVRPLLRSLCSSCVGRPAADTGTETDAHNRNNSSSGSEKPQEKPETHLQQATRQVFHAALISAAAMFITRPLFASSTFGFAKTGANEQGTSEPIPSWLWLTLYMIAGEVSRFVYSNKGLSQSNEMSHLGGGLGGFVAAVLSFGVQTTTNSVTSDVSEGDWIPATGLHLAVVSLFAAVWVGVMLKRALNEHPGLTKALGKRVCRARGQVRRSNRQQRK